MRKLYLKRVSTFLIASAIVAGVVFSGAPKTDAQFVPNAESGPLLQIESANLAANTTSAQADVAQQSKEFALDTIAYGVGRQIIRHITQSTVNWINSGFEGSPTFIQNPGEFFTDLGFQITGQFIDELGLGFLCEPFEFGISFALNLGTQNHLDRYECTALEIVNNFENGPVHLDAFFDVAVSTNNNPYGMYIETKNELEKRIASRLGIEKTILDFGDGFYSLKDSDGNITTPGKMIEDQLASVTSSDIRQLELADEMNEIIGAMANTLIKSVITGGGGLSGISRGGSSSGTQRYVDDVQNIDFTQNDIEGQTLGDNEFSVVVDEDVQRDFSDINDQNTGVIGSNPQTFGSAFETNLARDKTAIASDFDKISRAPTKAVDGVTNGSGSFGSWATAEEKNSTAWWQVDLEQRSRISGIDIWPPNGSPSSGYMVFILDENFGDVDIADFDSSDAVQFATNVFEWEVPTRIEVPEGTKGRYVRIQETGSSKLRLAEVVVNGQDTASVRSGDLTNNQDVVATASVIHGLNSVGRKYAPEKAIDFNTDPINFAEQPFPALVNGEIKTAWLEVDLDRNAEIREIIVTPSGTLEWGTTPLNDSVLIISKESVGENYQVPGDVLNVLNNAPVNLPRWVSPEEDVWIVSVPVSAQQGRRRNIDLTDVFDEYPDARYVRIQRKNHVPDNTHGLGIADLEVNGVFLE